MTTAGRRYSKKLLCLAMLTGTLPSIAFCHESENFREFRDTSAPGLESGIQSLIDGNEEGLNTVLNSLVEGLFAIYEPDAT